MQTAIRFTPMAKRLNVSAQHIQTIAEATASSFFQAIKGDDGKMITEIRPSDGFINATKMCESGRKTWSNYYQLAKTTKYITELERSLGIARELLVRQITDGPNNSRGTWVHPRIAINLASWISAVFEVKVSGTIERYIRGEITTEESQAAANIVSGSMCTAGNQAVTLSDTTQATRQPPRFQLKSAGFNNPADLQKPLMYFIAPGPLLIPTNEPIAFKSLITNDVIEKDDPPPYQQHDFDIVKFGISSNAMQRKRTHDNDFGECTLMDYITCDNTEELEKMAKCWFVAMNRLISAKSAKKNSQDTELVRPTTQEEYIYIVSKIYEMAQRCDSMAVSDELRIEMEKTAQKKEETAQEHAKISQLQLQLELKKLEFQMQLNNLEKTNTRVVGREAPAEVEQEQLEPTESDEMVSSETPSVEIPEAVDIQNSERSGSGNLNIVQI